MLEKLSANSRQDAERNFYKCHDCGPWIEFFLDGIKIGSIVEGCDFGTATYRLQYPFKEEVFQRCVDAIEEEASSLHEWANYTDMEGDAPDTENDFSDLFEYREGRC